MKNVYQPSDQLETKTGNQCQARETAEKHVAGETREKCDGGQARETYNGCKARETSVSQVSTGFMFPDWLP